MALPVKVRGTPLEHNGDDCPRVSTPRVINGQPKRHEPKTRSVQGTGTYVGPSITADQGTPRLLPSSVDDRVKRARTDVERPLQNSSDGSEHQRTAALADPRRCEAVRCNSARASGSRRAAARWHEGLQFARRPWLGPPLPRGSPGALGPAPTNVGNQRPVRRRRNDGATASRLTAR